MTKFDFELFVIGAGSGGVRAARVSAQMGARVAIAEENGFGGTCVMRGCIPKKLMVFASGFSEEFVDARGFGWGIAETRFDWGTFVARKDEEIGRARHHEGRFRYSMSSAASGFSCGCVTTETSSQPSRPASCK